MSSAPVFLEFVPHKSPPTILDPKRGAASYGLRASQVLAFHDGYGTGYIIGAITRRLGSLQALAPE